MVNKDYQCCRTI